VIVGSVLPALACRDEAARVQVLEARVAAAAPPRPDGMYFGGGTARCNTEVATWTRRGDAYLIAHAGPVRQARIRAHRERAAAHYDWLVELGKSVQGRVLSRPHARAR
jgi:hypothetical protein